MTQIEKREAVPGVEVRADGDTRTLVGYAAVFNSPANIGSAWTERFEPGAFTRALSADIRALVDHNSGRVIGRTKSGTLRLAQDTKGLRVEIDVPNTTDGNDLYALVERGDISGMSIGFIVLREEWDETLDPPVRTIYEAKLIEVSAVAFPAYANTEIGLRSLQEWRDAHPKEDDSSTENDNESIADTENPAATETPVNEVLNLKRRLSMDLDLKVRG